MNEIFLAKYGEIALKGLNKSSFEQELVRTIKRRVSRAGEFSVRRAQSTIYIEPIGACDMQLAETLLSRVFGISAVNRAVIAEKSFESLCGATTAFDDRLRAARTFRVEAKRADKSFPMDSMTIARELGGHILSRFPHLRVSMSNPDITVTAEVRDFGAYLHTGSIGAAGGMPTGTGGRVAVMLSGGIDSPVAAYMMARRGAELVAVHFESPPYTSPRALAKVHALASKISLFTGNLPTFSVPFTDIQTTLRDRCPEPLFTILMRRSMVRVCAVIAEREHCGAMVTGESLGQVASQTLEAIRCTDEASDYPILRPLIGMDKSDIVAIARRIDTFETSILPYEDCCTVFTPRHPKTKPRLSDILEAEQSVELSSIEREAAENAKFRMFHFFDSLQGGAENEG